MYYSKYRLYFFIWGSLSVYKYAISYYWDIYDKRWLLIGWSFVQILAVVLIRLKKSLYQKKNISFIVIDYLIFSIKKKLFPFFLFYSLNLRDWNSNNSDNLRNEKWSNVSGQHTHTPSYAPTATLTHTHTHKHTLKNTKMK